MSMIGPRSEAGSSIITTVFSLPLERTRYFLFSIFPSGDELAMSISTWNPVDGKRISSALATMLRAMGSTFEIVSDSPKAVADGPMLRPAENRQTEKSEFLDMS